jgi:hypothetical protein
VREEDIHRCVHRYPEDMGGSTRPTATIFRLPLRDESMARDCELYDQTVPREKIDRLFARFRRDVFNCLMILNSFRLIQLKEINE